MPKLVPGQLVAPSASQPSMIDHEPSRMATPSRPPLTGHCQRDHQLHHKDEQPTDAGLRRCSGRAGPRRRHLPEYVLDGDSQVVD